nr:HepT-like ribonuclease domain-containing protein [Paraburkholderia sacchari]
MLGVTMAQLQSNKVLQDAVCYQVLIIGEAASKILEADSATVNILDQGGQHGLLAALAKSKATRNLIIHQYHNITASIVWATVTSDELKEIDRVARHLEHKL